MRHSYIVCTCRRLIDLSLIANLGNYSGFNFPGHMGPWAGQEFPTDVLHIATEMPTFFRISLGNAERKKMENCP